MIIGLTGRKPNPKPLGSEESPKRQKSIRVFGVQSQEELYVKELKRGMRTAGSSFGNKTLWANLIALSASA